MHTELHTADSRGRSKFDWLDSRHTFSFGQYYDPMRMGFGALRVLNDDWVEGGYGFDTHPHKNMEIITIPLQGAVEHKDSTGRHKTIECGDVQIMSAGSGIRHSEYNASPTEKLNFLQIWILPDDKDIPPHYDQKSFRFDARKNELFNVVAPDNTEALWINQRAWLYYGFLEEGEQREYIIGDADKNGVYLFLVSGELEVADEILKPRDGIAISNFNSETLIMNPVEDCEILIMEVSLSIR